MSDSFYSENNEEIFANLKQAYCQAKRFLKLCASLQDASFRGPPLEMSGFLPDPNTAGSETADRETANRILQSLMDQLKVGNFSALPKLEVGSRAQLSGAWSQYNPQKNKIYLASDFVQAATEDLLVTVLLQEIINAIRSLIGREALGLDSPEALETYSKGLSDGLWDS